MRISRAGREFVTIPATGAPEDADPLEISLDDGDSWSPTTWEGTGDDRVVKVLVAGPDATGNPGGTVVAPVGHNPVKLRLNDGTEIVIRDSEGAIDVE